MDDGTIELGPSRTGGYRDFGPDGTTAVIWCHGGPGSRQDPELLADAFVEMGVRLVGIDRPGYGLSTPRPGRTIADWVPDALAVAGGPGPVGRSDLDGPPARLGPGHVRGGLEG